MTPPVVFAVAVSALAAPVEAQDPVSGFRCGTPYPSASDWDLEGAYGQRSVSIIAEALAGDKTRLSRFVAPNAKSIMGSHDVSLIQGAGPTGLVALFKNVAPRRYEFFNETGLPPPRDPCGKVTVKVMLEARPVGNGAVATFNYEQGLLVSVWAQDAQYIAGEFRR